MTSGNQRQVKQKGFKSESKETAAQLESFLLPSLWLATFLSRQKPSYNQPGTYSGLTKGHSGTLDPSL
jgi:hypothetical protein